MNIFLHGAITPSVGLRGVSDCVQFNLHIRFVVEFISHDESSCEGCWMSLRGKYQQGFLVTVLQTRLILFCPLYPYWLFNVFKGFFK